MARTKSPATPRAKPWGHATLLQLLIDLKSKQLEHLCFILHVSGKSGAPQLGVEFWETSGGRADYKFAYRHAGAYIDALWSDHRGVLTQAGTSKDERREMPAIVKADGSGLVAGGREDDGQHDWEFQREKMRQGERAAVPCDRGRDAVVGHGLAQGLALETATGNTRAET